ncbi:hypothetical protein ACYATL_07155 [Actinotignum timonense]|uniref:hypothetical protein n=1 Tax=Actinotignum TaxID=1653174 RepID=UPI002549E2B2|nr:hypothetical protein [Actinotignum timonense]MDK6907418.1 hypothetical protein [Actinotignum timonense]MDY5138690.1 hypothetical protein [Actinotignum timonense]
MNADDMWELGNRTENEVGAVLFNYLSLAISKADHATKDFPAEDYGWHRSMTVRAHLGLGLDQGGLPGGYIVGGNRSRMGQLIILNHEQNVRIRILKERWDYPGGIPIAGYNRARRDYYEVNSETLNRQLALPVVDPQAKDMEITSDTLNLIMGWNFKDPENMDQGFTARLVAPLEAGEYGKPVKSLFSIDIRPDTSIAYNELVFAQGDSIPNWFNPVGWEEENEASDGRASLL